MIQLVLSLNILWFAMGFISFSIRNDDLAKIVVPRKHRDSPLFQTVSQSGRFVGGFNFAFMLLAILLLLYLAEFPTDKQRVILFATFAVAHASQFYFNVPIMLKNKRTGDGVWPVLKGTMLFIFVTDFVMMVLNAGIAAQHF